jgi:hypothetical protein
LSAPGWAEGRARLAAPIFAPLRRAVGKLPRDRWPTPEDLCAAAQGIRTESGRALRFVAPGAGSRDERRHYELRVAETGEVETRPGNWHDLFNALAWMAFPRTKARVNAQHAAILAEGGAAEARRRGPERDALTLFDESGLIVASASPELLRLVAEHEWKALFWERRAELAVNVEFVAFGHGLYEKALDPFPGLVAKTVFVPVEALHFMLPEEARLERADALAAAHFAVRARFASPRAMAPLPVLGVPGWHPDGARESFYDDAAHFRPKRSAPRRKMEK